MSIQEYLKAHSLRISAFAAMTGISHGHITNVISGRRGLSVRMARRIEQATAGEVTAAEALSLSAPSCPYGRSGEVETT